MPDFSEDITIFCLLAAKSRYIAYGQKSRDEYLQYASQICPKLLTEVNGIMENMKMELDKTRNALGLLAKRKRFSN